MDMQDPVHNERVYRAFELMAAKDWAAAEAELKTGLEEAEAQQDKVLSALFYSSLGVLAKMQKDFRQAWKYYEKAEKLLPHDPALKLISASLLIDIFGQYDAAVRRCQKVLNLAPNDPPFLHQAHTTMGLAWLKQGKRAEAIQALGQAMEEGFEGLTTAANVDLKLVEALLQKKAGLKECQIYLEKARQFSESTQEPQYIELFAKLLQAFPVQERSGG